MEKITDVVEEEAIKSVNRRQIGIKDTLNYWLLENMKVMEELTVKEPVSWSEQDCGG